MKTKEKKKRRRRKEKMQYPRRRNGNGCLLYGFVDRHTNSISRNGNIARMARNERRETTVMV